MDFHQNDTLSEKMRDYISLRRKEQRLFPDEWVLNLPKIPPSSIHHKEWKIREKSMQRLLDYLPAQKKINVLDLGCGNGWLTNALAKNENYHIIGIEINDEEFAQAKRLFTADNCQFLQIDIFETEALPIKFDYIILNASFQYFPDPVWLIEKLFDFLSNGGEIHIIDTPIYKASDVPMAKKRSQEYFEKMGVADMQFQYFHHSAEMVAPFDHDYLYKPGSFLHRLIQRFTGKDSPFPWIRISGHKNGITKK